MNAMAGEMDKKVSKDQVRNKWLFGAAVAGTVGAVSELLHVMLENSLVSGGEFGRFVGNIWAKAIGVFGRVLGFAAAVIVAFFDFSDAWESYERREYGMAILYFVSGAASVGAVVALTSVFGATIAGLSSTGVGIVLAVIAILVGLLIAWFKDDELEAWLRRCWFGVAAKGADPLKDERFDTLKEESDALQLLLKAE